MVGSKKQLAILLTQLKTFTSPKIMLEQYPTEPDIAAELLWHAHMKGDIEDRKIADFGAGTGILGIGAAMLGAREVIFVETDDEAIATCKENIAMFDFTTTFTFLKRDIANVHMQCDLVIQNPPFGTKIKHHDRLFLEKAFATAPIIYSFHKTATKRFVEAMCRDHDFHIAEQFDFKFPLRNSMRIHMKPIEHIEVSAFRMVKA